ncbi:MAG TPA: PAS domain S-box protein [Anaerolineales bacterium]|nr:PAS domain S-box protein [Anaerolineales bacterium]
MKTQNKTTRQKNRGNSKSGKRSARQTRLTQAKSAQLLAPEQFVDIIEHMNDGVVVLDKDWHYVYVNQKAAIMLQRQKPSDLIGKQIWTEYPEGVGQPFHFAYEKAMKEQTPMVIEDYYAPWDRWFENRIYPLPDSLLILFTEITDRKRTEALLNDRQYLLQKILDTEPGTVYIFDLEERRNVYVNRHWLSAFGYTAEETQAMGDELSAMIFHPDDLPLIAEHHANWRQASEGEIRTIEYRVRSKTGQWRWLYSREAPFMRAESGMVRQILGIAHDVTEQIQMQEAVLKEIALSDAMLNSLPGVFYFYDRTGKFLRWNKNFEVVSGYSAEEIAQMHPLDFFLGKEKEYFAERIEQVFDRGESDAEANFTAKNRELFPYYFTGKRIEMEGQPYLIGMGIDIRERKRAEESLRESEARYRTVVENQTEFIVHWKPDGTRTFANEAYLRYFRLAPEQMISSSFMPLVAEEDRVAVEGKISRLVSGSVDSEVDVHRVIRPDGRIGWQEWVDQAIHDESGRIVEFQSVGRDITDRKQAEEALREKTEESERFFNSALDLLCIADNDGYFRRLNREWEKVLGYRLEDLEGKRFLDLVHPDDMQDTLGAMAELDAQEEVLDFTNRYRCKDGTYRWIEWRSIPHGKLVYATARDITERKRIESALRESEKRYRDLVEFSPVAMTVHVEGRIVYINPAGARLWGADTPDEVLGRSPLDFVHPEYHERITERIEQIQAVEQSPPPIEVKNTRLDGQTLYTVGTGIPITYGGKPAILSVVLDITKRKLAEERLRELTRQLIAAQEAERKRIAQELHDELGQAMTAISLDLGGIEKALPAEASRELRERLIDARSMADAVDEQISEMALDLRPSLLDDLGLLPALQWYLNRYSQRTGIEVATDFEDLESRLPDEVETTLYRVIQEALTNIARHAQAGKVLISLDRSAAAVTASIQDNGRGFDVDGAQGPAASPGSMGLLGIRDRVSTLGGQVYIRSGTGQGTRIQIELPL